MRAKQLLQFFLRMSTLEKTSAVKTTALSSDLLLKAFRLMATAKSMAELYEENAKVTAKYVHATSRGHEACQIAMGLQLLPQDYLSAYYRDDSTLLAIGVTPYELMLQLLAKRDDPFSGGRTYYSHPSLNRADLPKIPHQSSATGMQAIPTTGIALGIQYKEQQGIADNIELKPIVVCSIGDAAMTEGEVSEAFHMATLRKLPIIYFVQDNEWDISAHSSEIRFGDAVTFSRAFNVSDPVPASLLLIFVVITLFFGYERRSAGSASKEKLRLLVVFSVLFFANLIISPMRYRTPLLSASKTNR